MPDERDGRGGGFSALQAHQQQVIHTPAVVTGGAVVHIPAAGNAKSVITCRVLLLDGSDVNVDLPVSFWISLRPCFLKAYGKALC